MGVVGIDFGLTPTGFVTRTAVDLRAEAKARLQGEFGASFDVGDASVAGNIVGVVMAAAGELWEVAEQAAESNDRDAAQDTQLDGIGALGGVLRQAPTNSTVTVIATGTPGAAIDDGFQAATASTGVPFVALSGTNVTIATVQAWATSTAYQIGDLVTNATRVYLCLAPGTSTTAPTTQDALITDGVALKWSWVGDGTGAASFPMQAVDVGDVVAVSRDLNVIRTPTFGVSNVINPNDARPGALREDDADYRVRQVEELAGRGASTADTIRASMIDAGATACTVFNNTTDNTVDSVPPHAFETLVQGLDEATIVSIIQDQLVVGINTFGNHTVSVTDSQGAAFTISYSRPVEVPIYVMVQLIVGTDYGGDAAATQAIVTYGANQQVIGKDAVAGSIGSATLPVIVKGARVAGCTGVIKVSRTLVYTDLIANPVAWAPSTTYSATPGARSVVTNDGGRAYICITGGVSAASGGPSGVGQAIADGGAVWWFLGNDIAISTRQLALLDTSRITIQTTAGTP